MFIAPRIADLTAMIHRAVDRGEIDPLPNPTLAAEMLIGVLYFRDTVTGEPIDLPLVDDLMALAMRMLGAQSTQRPSRAKRRGSSLANTHVNGQVISVAGGRELTR